MPKKKSRKITLLVTFDLPPDASRAQAMAYVADAVGSMKGCLKSYGADPNDPQDYDPMSELDPDSVKVRYVKKED